MASKVIVLGSINGRFREVFEKVSRLHAKNNFDFAIVSGDLFASPEGGSDSHDEAISDLLSGKITIPLTTYFNVGHHALPAAIVAQLEKSETNEVCENLTYLGKRGAFNTLKGVRIAALGGTLDPKLTKPSSKDELRNPTYSVHDARALRGAKTADILITSEWPQAIQQGSKKTLDDKPTPTTRECISELCSDLKPQYHFSTSPNLFYEREPFFHIPEPSDPAPTYPVTRFYSLAQFGNAPQQKWMYAFNIEPSLPAAQTAPPNATASPFALLSKKRAPDGPPSRWSTNGDHHARPSKRARRNEAPPGPQECFFCLSNPNIAMQLVVSIGMEAYMTTAKGPVTTSRTFPELGGCPGHVLLVPLAHSATLNSIPDPVSREATVAELRKYRAGVHKMLNERGQGGLGAVTWEVSRSSGIHTIWQMVPMKAHDVRRGLVETGFRVEAENEKYPEFEKGDVEDDLEQNDCFKVWLWAPEHVEAGVVVGKEMDKKLVLPLDQGFRFDLQFGRKVVAKLLGLDSRMDWRACGQSVPEETRDAEAFKKAFKDYDFSLQE